MNYKEEVAKKRSDEETAKRIAEAIEEALFEPYAVTDVFFPNGKKIAMLSFDIDENVAKGVDVFGREVMIGSFLYAVERRIETIGEYAVFGEEDNFVYEVAFGDAKEKARLFVPGIATKEKEAISLVRKAKEIENAMRRKKAEND